MSNLSDFDLDLSYGKAGETLVEELLTGGKTIEVKRDKRWADTGNVYVEIECHHQSSRSWVPSGINATKAAYWAFVLEEAVFMIPTEALKYAVAELGTYATREDHLNPSKGILLKLPDLIKATKEYNK